MIFPSRPGAHRRRELRAPDRRKVTVALHRFFPRIDRARNINSQYQFEIDHDITGLGLRKRQDREKDKA